MPPPRLISVKVKQDARRALHLFSGPSNRTYGISSTLREVGWGGDDIDMCNSSPEDNGYNDLLNDANWISIQANIRQGKYTVVFMGTPCNTVSLLGSHPGGPPPLRSKTFQTTIEDTASLWDSKQFKQLANLPGVKTQDFDQCTMGSVSTTQQE
jgi:hypothetical protein